MQRFIQYSSIVAQNTELHRERKKILCDVTCDNVTTPGYLLASWQPRFQLFVLVLSSAACSKLLQSAHRRPLQQSVLSPPGILVIPPNYILTESRIALIMFSRLSSASFSLSVTTSRHMKFSSSRVPIVGGNWKLNAGNGTTAADVDTLVNVLNSAENPGKCEVVCAPPAIYLDRVKQTLNPDKFQVAAQNCFHEEKGAYTGENSAAMLKDLGIGWTLIGHSERRDIFGEKDDMLEKKIAHALTAGLSVIACCGEHKEDREAGTTMDVLIPQLQAIVNGVANSSGGGWGNLVIAYEPVWAIGTGLTATPKQAQDTHADIRAWLISNAPADVAENVRIQYGGSVNDENAAELGAMPDIDGFLVGGASLDAVKFSTIYSALA